MYMYSSIPLLPLVLHTTAHGIEGANEVNVVHVQCREKLAQQKERKKERNKERKNSSDSVISKAEVSTGITYVAASNTQPASQLRTYILRT